MWLRAQSQLRLSGFDLGSAPLSNHTPPSKLPTLSKPRLASLPVK